MSNSPERRLRILYVSDTGGQLGGAERSLLSLIEHLDPARYERHSTPPVRQVL